MRRRLRWRVRLLLTVLGSMLLAAPLAAQPPQGAFGFNGTVSGFPTGVVSVTGAALTTLAPTLSRPPAALAASRMWGRDL
jgi:hypothetical protein